jgi:vacuolar iron transporter family protein
MSGPAQGQARPRHLNATEPEHGHDSASIRRRLAAGPPVSYLRDWVYGGIDGAVTTFAIVAGADLSPRVVLILGVANLVGDGFSMAAGDFSATRAERDEHAHLRRMEERHVDLVPEGEREEVREIYRKRHLAGTLRLS